jgi:hypothetical protein
LLQDQEKSLQLLGKEELYLVEGKAGDWVQVRRIVLQPGQRAPQVPADTQAVPLIMLVKGFLQHDARIGEEVTITTVIGRQVKGELVAVNPTYDHNYGRPVPELLVIGPELRQILWGEEGAK